MLGVSVGSPAEHGWDWTASGASRLGGLRRRTIAFFSITATLCLSCVQRGSVRCFHAKGTADCSRWGVRRVEAPPMTLLLIGSLLVLIACILLLFLEWLFQPVPEERAEERRRHPEQKRHW